MNSFLIYLIVINVTTFLAFVIDFLLCSWKPEINDKAANALVMDVFPIAGGSVGMLLALFAFVWDKHAAANGNDYRRRAPEARLLGLGLVGGSLGGLLAINIVRHKTKKWYFVWGLPCFMVLNIAAILYAHMSGLV